MPINLRAELPRLLPGAIAWAEARAREVAATGVALNGAEAEIAARVGVQRPELIRVAVVESIPQPDDPTLRTAAIQTGLLRPDTVGLTLGYSIFVVRGHRSVSVLSHEFRHVHQYEAHGSIADFLPLYLQQIVEVGYDNALYELDAQAHEIGGT